MRKQSTMFLAVLLAVMFMFVGIAQAGLDTEITLEGKQSSLNEKANNHYIGLSGKLIYTHTDLSIYFSAAGDFSNEEISDFNASGELYKIGVSHPLGVNGTLDITASSNHSYLGYDEELIVVSYTLKVKLLE